MIKTRIILTTALIVFSTTIFSQSETSPLFNPKASGEATDNLNVGDIAIVVDRGLYPVAKKIYQKKDGMYQVAALDASEGELKNKQNALTWYKANSVYRYYDVKSFKEKTSKYNSTIEAFMWCFSKKFNLNIDVVTGNKNYPIYYIKDAAQKSELTAKLEELSQIIEKEFPSLPNTFLPYANNPVIWKLIAKNRVEMIDCLSKISDPNQTKMVDFYMKEIASAKIAAENFKGGTEGLYDGNNYPHMERAVSKSARDEWFKKQDGWNTNTEVIANFNKALDDLKSICIQKIPLLKMSSNLFQYHDVAAETVMKNYLKNPGTLKTYKSGISDPDWIYLKNSVGVILYRYKRGTMWVKNSADDHQLCKALFFVIKEEYTGSGYSKAIINEYSEELRGCP